MANIGLEGVLYNGVAGTTAATEMTNVRDLTWNDDRDEADVSSRGSEFKLTRTTMRNHSLGWQMLVDDDDTDYAAMKAAFVGNTVIALKCISKSDGSGIDADYQIKSFGHSEALTDAQYVDVEAIPTYLTRYPSSVAAS
jgi:hypothetical protein